MKRKMGYALECAYMASPHFTRSLEAAGLTSFRVLGTRCTQQLTIKAQKLSVISHVSSALVDSFDSFWRGQRWAPTPLFPLANEQAEIIVGDAATGCVRIPIGR